MSAAVTATHPANPLIECSAELLAVVMPLRSGREGGAVPEDFRERVLQAFDTLERMALERQITTAHVQEAKYALAAFVDESVLASEWDGRLDWMSQPLQLEFFGEHLAGEGFFRHLATLRQGGDANIDLLELYYLCLQLGFEGVYRMRGIEQLMALQVDLRSQIDGVRGVADPRLSVDGVPREGMLQRVGRHVPFWVIGAVTGAAVALAYTGYVAVSHATTGKSVQTLERVVQAIPQTAPGNTGGGDDASAGEDA